MLLVSVENPFREEFLKESKGKELITSLSLNGGGCVSILWLEAHTLYTLCNWVGRDTESILVSLNINKWMSRAFS